VAVVLVIALLTFSNAHGQQQRTDSSAVFEGRPAMAGAQAGAGGALAGPPQGGIGVQGQDQSQVPGAIDQSRAVREDKDIVKRDRDSGVKPEQRSIAQRAKNAVRRIVQRARHGVSDRDVQTAQHE
jgi:hypothetical protein